MKCEIPNTTFLTIIMYWWDMIGAAMTASKKKINVGLCVNVYELILSRVNVIMVSLGHCDLHSNTQRQTKSELTHSFVAKSSITGLLMANDNALKLLAVLVYWFYLIHMNNNEK